VREADDGECDHRVLRVGGDVANEGVVDLERVDRETLQVREARIAVPKSSTEIFTPESFNPRRVRAAPSDRSSGGTRELELDERRIEPRFPQMRLTMDSKSFCWN